MLILFQFPFIDTRIFVRDNGRLVKPIWASPTPNREFVRNLGIIRERDPGGEGVVGEKYCCVCNRAIRFQTNKITIRTSKDKEITGVVLFKRLFFDGWVFGRFEIGIVFNELDDSIQISEGNLKALMLSEVTIPDTSSSHPLRAKLIQAGKSLSRLYLSSSTFTSYKNNQKLPTSWVVPCDPIIIIELNGKEHLSLTSGTSVPVNPDLGIELTHHKVCIRQQQIRVWELNSGQLFASPQSPDNAISRKRYKELRVYLLKNHVILSGLREMLGVISSKQIDLTPDTAESNILHNFIELALKQLENYHQLSSKISTENESIEWTAGKAEGYITADKIIELQENILNLNLNIKIQSRLQFVLGRNIDMSTKIEQNQTIHGSVIGSQIKQTQTSIQQPSYFDSVDLPTLIVELTKLKNECKKQDLCGDHDSEIGRVADAITAAKGNDRKKLEDSLKQAGKWVLGIAESILVATATAALMAALGL
jgi:hypothetical protein